MARKRTRNARIGYYRRRKPKSLLLQNYIGVDHALAGLQQRIASMKNPTKRKIIDEIKAFRALVAEYSEAVSPGSSKALWSSD